MAFNELNLLLYGALVKTFLKHSYLYRYVSGETMAEWQIATGPRGALPNNKDYFAIFACHACFSIKIFDLARPA